MSPIPSESSDIFVDMQQEVARISSLPEVRAALSWLRNQETKFAHGNWKWPAFPRLPLARAARGAWLQDRFRELGLEAVSTDEVGNVSPCTLGATDYASRLAPT